MNSKKQHDTTITLIRLKFIFGLGLALFVLLITRLVDVQLVQGEAFVKAANNNRFFEQYIPAERGVFLDRFGEPLVYNRRRYEQLLNPNQLFSDEKSLSTDEAFLLMATQSAAVQKDFIRWYPYPALSQVLGYITPVTAEDLDRRDDLALRDSVGRAGLERAFDKELQGIDGVQRIEVDARGNRLRPAERKDPKPGAVIATSLDPYLSQVAAEALGNNKGVVLISDARTGQVLTMVSSPSFDSELFTPNYDQPQLEQHRMEKINQLFSDSTQPFFNRALSGAYPPGSVFKVVTALASLSEGAVDATTTVVDEGVLKVGEYEYGNWYFRQYGRTEGEIGLVRAIARSNDIFFYKAAEWTSPNKLATDARTFGFGKTTGIELAGEVGGTVPDPAWKEATLGEPWYLGNTYHFGIGQGDLLVTPLQVLQMTQTVANHGELCKPHLLEASDGACTLVGLKDEHLELVLQGMLDACSPGGTAYPLFERNGALRTHESAEGDIQKGAVACKTGTAEFGGADAQGYRKTHGWWIGVVEPHIPERSSEARTRNDQALTETTLPTAALATGSAQLRSAWGEHVKKSGFPERLALTVLIESDEVVPFREGSRDSAPIGKKIIDWLEGK